MKSQSLGLEEWYGGLVACLPLQQARYTVYYNGDASYTRQQLSPKRYGPATVTKCRDGGDDKLSAGWVFLVPTTEAGGESVKVTTLAAPNDHAGAAAAPKVTYN